MKTTRLQCQVPAGFTLAEMMISIGVLGILGAVFFSVLNSGVVLFAKNAAVNAAHEETRQGINRLTRDVHASISVPQLRTSAFAVKNSQPAPDPSATPIAASGVSFQNIAGGPFAIWKDTGNASLIKIKDYGNKPIDGQRIIVPFWGLEDDIVNSTANGTMHHTNVFLKNGWPGDKLPRDPGGAHAIIYYTDRVMYVVRNGRFIRDTTGDYWPADGDTTSPSTNHANFRFRADSDNGNGKRFRYEGGELHLYKQRYAGSNTFWDDTAVVARNLTTPFPFSVPLNSGGTANTKYVAVKLAAADPKSSNRGFIATNSLLDTQIDYRAAITVKQ